jgi:hypothetical protein
MELASQADALLVQRCLTEQEARAKPQNRTA